MAPDEILLTRSSLPRENSRASKKSGVVSTGRSAASPESLKVKVCDVIPRAWRTPEGVRGRNLRSTDGEDVGVDGPGVVAV